MSTENNIGLDSPLTPEESVLARRRTHFCHCTAIEGEVSQAAPARICLKRASEDQSRHNVSALG
jgi:hypothetical protein